jgi:hypothetical protein
VLLRRHPAGGLLDLAAEGDVMVLRCHWPVDLEDDEWIDIQNRYSMSSYVRAISNAMTTGNGEASGVAGGFLRFNSLSDGFHIDFSRPEIGWLAASLLLYVKRPIGELPGAPAVR